MDNTYKYYSELGNSRSQLVELIKYRTGYKAYSYESGAIRPPGYIVFPDTPYISDDQPRTFKNINSNYQVLIISSKIIAGREQAAADELDLMIEGLVKNFNMINYSSDNAVEGITLLRIDGITTAKSKDGDHFTAIGYFVISNEL